MPSQPSGLGTELCRFYLVSISLVLPAWSSFSWALLPFTKVILYPPYLFLLLITTFTLQIEYLSQMLCEKVEDFTLGNFVCLLRSPHNIPLLILHQFSLFNYTKLLWSTQKHCTWASFYAYQ